jgi:hypothetical protein
VTQEMIFRSTGRIVFLGTYKVPKLPLILCMCMQLLPRLTSSNSLVIRCNPGRGLPDCSNKVSAKSFHSG